jgi:hypothetical protein
VAELGAWARFDRVANLYVTVVLQGCYSGVTRVLEGCYKGVSVCLAGFCKLKMGLVWRAYLVSVFHCHVIIVACDGLDRDPNLRYRSVTVVLQ